MTDILKLTVSLTFVAGIAGFAIGLANNQTKQKIEEQLANTQIKALHSVVPSGSTIKKFNGTGELPSEYWIAYKETSPVAYAFKLASRGYAANIVFITGVDTTGQVIGINILEQSETPGLGARVQEVVSKKYIWNGLMADKEKNGPWFSEQFKGLDVNHPLKIDKGIGEWHTLDQPTRNELAGNNTVTAITGSTISTRAVVKALETDVAKYFSLLSKSEQ